MGGATQTFDACPTITSSNAPFQLFYSLSADANGQAVLRGGIKVPIALPQQQQLWS